MTSPRALRLASNALLVPTDAGWLAAGAPNEKPLATPGDRRASGDLLALFDGTRDATQVARESGLDEQQLQRLLRAMRRRGWLARARAAAMRRPRLDVIEADPMPALSNGRGVLLVGLGTLGIAVLRTLAPLWSRPMTIFDPLRAGGVDPLEWNDRDRGRPRHDAIRDRLSPEIAARVTVSPTAVDDLAALDAAMSSAVSAADAVIVCADAATPLVEAAARAGIAHGVPVMAVELTPSGARLSVQQLDVATAGRTACVACAATHRRAREPFEWWLARYVDELFPRPLPWRYPHDDQFVWAVAQLVSVELLALFDAPQPGGRHLTVDAASSSSTVRAVATHPGCPVCVPGTEPGVTALLDACRLRWERFKGDDQPAPSLHDLRERLRPLVDADFGLFDSLEWAGGDNRRQLGAFFTARGLPAHAVPLVQAHRVRAYRTRVRDGAADTSPSHGFSFDDVASAEALALIESLERQYGIEYVDPRRTVTASYAEVAPVAIDPVTLPLYADAQYDVAGFRAVRFDPQAPVPWVGGVRLHDRTPVLVPRDVMTGNRRPLLQATSSGCAAHSSVARAVLNGLQEVLERDALMIAWLNQLSLPRVTMRDEPDPWEVRATLTRAGFRLTHVDLTTDLGVPVLLLAVEDERDPSFFMTTMATAQTAEGVVEKLYKEIVHFCYPLFVSGEQLRTPLSRSRDPFAVEAIVDHVVFYQHRRKRRHTRFLTASKREVTLGSRFPSHAERTAEQELDHLVTRLHAQGYDVIAIDGTPDWLAERGVHVVKVVVPGLQALNGGHRYRVLGGRRVLEAARRMGYADRDRAVEELNPWPHPFW